MLQWSEAHPYNAIHVVRIPGDLEMMRLRRCLDTVVEHCGLSRLTLDRARSAFQYEGGPADCEMQILGGGDRAWPALVGETERQLNLPFPSANQFHPFRWLAVRAEGCFYLGLVYYHPVADAESIAFLLRDVANVYLGKSEAGALPALNLYPDSRTHLCRRHPLLVVRKLLAMVAQFRNLRQSRRVGHHDVENLANGFALFSLSPAELQSLVAAAKSWEVTVNDLLMALLLKALAPVAASRTRSPKRRKLSLGCIVNLRQDLGWESRRTFGLFLGSFIVTLEVPTEIALRALAREICSQTRLIKRQRLYLGTTLELGIARLALKCLSPQRRRKFYAKNYPLWGGITNMNLNSLWRADDHAVPADYFRGVSTGPVTPLVLSVTTIADRMNFGLSYRTALFSRTEIEGLQRCFLAQLTGVGKDA
jgi:hypothetical protein